MGKMATMKQVANQLGLSRRTVSSVINNLARERGVADHTAERIKNYLHKIGYVPCQHATRLRKSKESVGIIYQGWLYSFLFEDFNRIVYNFSDRTQGVEILAVQENIVEGLRELLARRVTRLIWIHASIPGQELKSEVPLMGYLKNFEQVVFYNYRFGHQPEWDALLEEAGIHRVAADRQSGFRQLAAFLKDLGHRKVLIPHWETIPQVNEARPGFGAEGLEIVFQYPENVKWNVSPDYGKRLASSIIQAIKQDGITAACVLDDELAGYVMAELLDCGVRIPKDLTVTGFGGLDVAATFRVPLTSLAVPNIEMVLRLEEILAGKHAGCRHIIPMRIITRKSHGDAAVIGTGITDYPVFSGEQKP